MRDPVRDAVDRVVWLVLERLEDVGVVLEQVQIDRLDEAAAHEAQARVTRRGHDVELLRVRREEGVRLVRRPEDLRVDLASRLGLEVGHPVDGRIGRAVLDVPGPRQDVDALALRAAELGRHARCRRAAGCAASAAATGADDDRHHGGERHRSTDPHRSPPPSDQAPSAMDRACCRFHTRRTALPCCASASVDDVARFCWVTTSRAPASSVTT